MTCPECGGGVARQRQIWRYVWGLFLIVVAILLILPTFCASAILAVYGVYQMAGVRHCESCGWVEGRTKN